MEIGISSWSLYQEFGSGALDALGFPVVCAERLGIRALEYNEAHLGSTERGHLEAVKEAVRGAGCWVACVAANNDFTMVSDTERAEQIAYVKRVLEAGARLGAGCVKVNAGARSKEDGAEQRVVRAIQECVSTAQATGVRIALENGGGLSSNPDAVVRIVKAVGLEWFGTCPDWGNFAPDDRYSGLERVLPFAMHCHAKSVVFDEKGWETKVDFRRAMEVVKGSGYNGVLSIEFEGSAGGYEGVAKTKELLARLI